MFRKIAVFALLFVLVLASFPTNNVLAKDAVAEKLEKKWDQLVESYNVQNIYHEKTHKLVENYLKTHKNIKAADKAELEKHLAICNSALASAAKIVANHPGFDAKGNVVDKAVAQKTIRDLANLIRQHDASVKRLSKHTE